MNRVVLLALASLCTGPLMTHAEPLVPGYARFYSAAPSPEGGRILYNELGCANCHEADTELPARRGPELRGITGRVQSDWLRRFLADPDAVHPGSNMPDVLPQDSEAVEAVVHYLASLKPKVAVKAKNPPHVNALRGEALFHTIGCIACHQTSETFIPEEGRPNESERSYPTVAFPNMAGKYSLASLTSFVSTPLQTRTDGRMPHVQLEETEAADIAGYILGFEESDGKTAAGIGAIAPDPLLAKRGQELVKSARCAACHELPKELANERFVVRDAEAGCLKDGSTREVPRYRLTQNQRAALSMYLADRNHVLTAPEKAQLILKTLNCCACHERDGTGGPDAFHRPYFVGDHNLGDTGRYPPPLTGVGGKLQPDWLEAVLQGGNRVRSYLKTRMPVYGGATEGLALLLERTDSGTKHTLPGGDDAAGRKLLGTQGGIGCITCHRWGEHAALGIQALDLSNLGQRLKPEWLLEYLIDPAAYRPGTLMPSFWPGGKSSNLMILQGDTSRQIASIYSFAKSANGEPEGFREFKNGQFELLPKEKPIIQRTFLKDVGTHAILVGFPTGVHLAVDGKSGQPALVWKGRFFDAYTTWFSRFAPFENPLGENVLKWSAVTSSGQQRRFDGYRLDAKGSPIFLYSISGVSVEDHFEGVENGIERSISWPPDASEPPVTHPDAMTVREEPTDGRGQRRFTYFWK